MSLEDLRSKVLGKAEEKARKIKENANRKAKEIIERAKEEYRIRYEQSRKAALTELRAQEFKKYTSKVMELNKELLMTKQELIKEIIEEAKNKLSHLPPKVRKESLKKLLLEALNTEVIKGPFIAQVLGRDEDLFREAVQELKISSNVIKVEELSEERLGGLLILSPDRSFAVDNTYSTRLERALSILYRRVKEEIFKG